MIDRSCREEFWQILPSQVDRPADYRIAAALEGAPQIHLKALNHAALEAADVPGLTDFYTRVLSFNSIDRPDFPFEGSWLEGAGLLLHIIQEDPSVPKQINDWKVSYIQHPLFTTYQLSLCQHQLHYCEATFFAGKVC